MHARPHALASIPLTALLLVGAAHAQTVTPRTLEESVTLALRAGPDVASARASLSDAQTNLSALRADPSALLPDTTQAQQAVTLGTAQLAGTRMTVMQNVVNAYLNLYETQRNVALLQSQAELDAKNVQVAQAKLQARSGTSLDVAKAQNTLGTTRQNLANAQAQLTVQASALAKLFGQTGAAVKTPPAPPALKVTLASLSQGLESRLPTLVSAKNAADLADLNVKLSDNDYTPRLTLESARTKAQNAQRDLENARRSATNALTDAYRAAQDAAERVSLQQKNLANAQSTLNQANVRYRSGVISRLELDTTAQTVESARFALTQAQDASWKALAALGAASGVDVAGLMDGAS
ncbi:TolC family protein [Deinococcus pimensis]|uniref:TolC family protein n=1 Tax=Deinococcus pimensis TaxID=309888 RepID=UPI0004BB82AB|nr:TolC family protein [Deinococcus pimensis]